MKQNIKSLNPAFLCQCTLPKIPSIIITINKYIDTTAVVCYSVWDPTLRVFKLRYMKDIDGEKNRANYYLNTMPVAFFLLETHSCNGLPVFDVATC